MGLCIYATLIIKVRAGNMTISLPSELAPQDGRREIRRYEVIFRGFLQGPVPDRVSVSPDAAWPKSYD